MKQRNKIKDLDKQKIQARYDAKFEEFKQLSLDELKNLYTTTKMSSTDKYAIIHATDAVMKTKIVETAKEIGNELKTEV